MCMSYVHLHLLIYYPFNDIIKLEITFRMENIGITSSIIIKLKYNAATRL